MASRSSGTDFFDDHFREPTPASELLDLLEPPPAWHARARCRGFGTGSFFLEVGSRSIAAARACCAACEVREDCLDFALREGDQLAGIWGGTTPQERRVLRRLAKRKAS